MAYSQLCMQLIIQPYVTSDHCNRSVLYPTATSKMLGSTVIQDSHICRTATLLGTAAKRWPLRLEFLNKL